jgi:hypothetical protein
MKQGDGADAHDDNEDSFEKLEGGNGPEHAPLATVMVRLGGGVAHEQGGN